MIKLFGATVSQFVVYITVLLPRNMQGENSGDTLTDLLLHFSPREAEVSMCQQK